MIKFIDLFAGIGGIRLGFQQALKENYLKGKCVFVSEIKPWAKKVYQENFPYPKISGNIKKINAKDIPNFDFLLGGFPCQSFSMAGKQLGFKDTRGTLFFDIARILKEKQPQGFLLENVPALLTNHHGDTFHVILKVLHHLGYSVGYHELLGSDFGLAQKRKRLYIIGMKSKQPKSINMKKIRVLGTATIKNISDYRNPPKNDSFAKKLFKYYTFKQVLGKRIRNNRGSSYNIHSWDFNLSGKTNHNERLLLDKLIPACRKHKWAKEYGIKWSDGMPLTEKMIKSFCPIPNLHNSLKDLVKKHYLTYQYPKQTINHHRRYVTTVPKGYKIVSGALAFEYMKILSPDGYAPTLTATDMSRLAIPVNNGIRPIDSREGLRLFGFPDTFKMSGISQQKQYDLIGNTVCVPVIKVVANCLIKNIIKNKKEK